MVSLSPRDPVIRPLAPPSSDRQSADIGATTVQLHVQKLPQFYVGRVAFLAGSIAVRRSSGAIGGSPPRREPPLLAYSGALSPIGYAADDPLDDRVESLSIERMSAVDAEFGDEVAGNLGHDLVCIP